MYLVSKYYKPAKIVKITDIDDLQKIFAIYGIDLMTKIKIASLENTKMKEILYDESNKTNK